MFKPFVAKSGDKKLKAAFDTITSGLRKVIKDTENGEGGSYADFLGATKLLSKKAQDSVDGKDKDKFTVPESESEKKAREADAVYASVMKERGKPSAALFKN